MVNGCANGVTLSQGKNTMQKQVIAQGRIATLTRARKPFQCQKCLDWIKPGELYYSVTVAGSGLGGFKFPERLHIQCFVIQP